MSEGLSHDVVLKIGFLNEWKSSDKARLEAYKANFDVVLINDDTMHFPIQLIQQIFYGKEPIEGRASV